MLAASLAAATTGADSFLSIFRSLQVEWSAASICINRVNANDHRVPHRSLQVRVIASRVHEGNLPRAEPHAKARRTRRSDATDCDPDLLSSAPSAVFLTSRWASSASNCLFSRIGPATSSTATISLCGVPVGGSGSDLCVTISAPPRPDNTNSRGR